MTNYNDQFKKPSHYYKKINRLVDHYRHNGYVHLVSDWEGLVSKIADMSDLRRLANRASDIYQAYEKGALL